MQSAAPAASTRVLMPPLPEGARLSVRSRALPRPGSRQGPQARSPRTYHVRTAYSGPIAVRRRGRAPRHSLWATRSGRAGTRVRLPRPIGGRVRHRALRGDVAQLEEHRVRIAGVRGSSPLISTTLRRHSEGSSARVRVCTAGWWPSPGGGSRPALSAFHGSESRLPHRSKCFGQRIVQLGEWHGVPKGLVEPGSIERCT